MKKLITAIILSLVSFNLWANMPHGIAEKLLKNNSLPGENAGMVISNPDGGYLALVTDINVLRSGSKIVSLLAIAPDQSKGQMISIDGDVGHTGLILGRYNQVETSYGKYPAHEIQAVFAIAAVTNEPVPGEIVKKAADYLDRINRSKNDNGITFLLSDRDYERVESIIERDVKKDRKYDLNCDNCSTWAIDTLKKIGIDFNNLVGASDITPWDISDFAEDTAGDSELLENIFNKYQGIKCANPLDITDSLAAFWDRLGVQQVALDERSKYLDEEQQSFLQTIGQYVGVSLDKLELAVNSDASINAATEGSLTKNISNHLSLFDFAIDASFLKKNDPVKLNKAMLALLRANVDLAGLRGEANALSVIVKENKDGEIEIINEWLGINLQISFYLSEKRDIRLLVRGGVAVQSSSNSETVLVPFNATAAVQFHQFILSYNYETTVGHRLRLQYELTPTDSLFLEGKVNTQDGEPEVCFTLGYCKKLK